MLTLFLLTYLLAAFTVFLIVRVHQPDEIVIDVLLSLVWPLVSLVWFSEKLYSIFLEE